jgi:hypothetical protein
MHRTFSFEAVDDDRNQELLTMNFGQERAEKENDRACISRED